MCLIEEINSHLVEYILYITMTLGRVKIISRCVFFYIRCFTAKCRGLNTFVTASVMLCTYPLHVVTILSEVVPKPVVGLLCPYGESYG